MEEVSDAEFELHADLHLDAVSKSGEPLMITRSHGGKPLVVMPLQEFEGWRETVHLLSSPANAAVLLRSIKDVGNRNFVQNADLDSEAV
jgi:antitoxin YefM